MSEIDIIPQTMEKLERYEKHAGMLKWVASVDHKQVAVMYMLTSLFFFLVGGVEALVMRLQLARPENRLLTPEAYNQLFTLHGTTMIFWWPFLRSWRLGTTSSRCRSALVTLPFHA